MSTSLHWACQRARFAFTCSASPLFCFSLHCRGEGDEEQEEGEEDGEGEEEGEEAEGPVLGRALLQQLVMGARSQGLDVTRAIAEAMALGGYEVTGYEA